MRFYVYELVVIPDGRVCYVGKGSKNRAWSHRDIVVKRHKIAHKGLYRRLAELLESGKDWEVRIVERFDDSRSALLAEEELISKYGLSNLFNVKSASGETNPELAVKSLRKYHDEMRAKTGCSRPASFRAAMRAAHAAGKFNEAYAIRVKKAQVANTGKARSEETRRKQSLAQKGRQFNQEHRQKIRASKLGKRLPADVVDKMLRSRAKIRLELIAKAELIWPNLGRLCYMRRRLLDAIVSNPAALVEAKQIASEHPEILAARLIKARFKTLLDAPLLPSESAEPR